MGRQTIERELSIAVQVRQAQAAPAPPAYQWLFAMWMAVASLIAVVAGLVLGILAAAELSVGGSRWTQSVQAHGRLQLFGLVATFVVALALEFLVRLNARPMYSWRVRAGLPALMAAGAILLAAGQIWFDSFGFLAPAGAVVFLCGATSFAVLTFRIPLRNPSSVDPQPLFMRAAAAWLAVAAALAVWGSVESDFGVVPLDLSFATIEVFLRGFVTMAIAGISLRAITGHLGLRPVTVRQQLTVFSVLNASVAALVLSSGIGSLDYLAWLERVADGAFAAGLLAFTYLLGVIPAVRRWRGAPRYMLVVPLAWISAAAYCLLLLALAVLPNGRSIGLYEEGAIRHTYLLGFVIPLMVAMAHVVLARFAVGYVPWENALSTAFFLLLAAVPLRVAPFLFEDAPSDVSRWLLSTAGLMAMVALLLVAAVCLRTARLMTLRLRPRRPMASAIR